MYSSKLLNLGQVIVGSLLGFLMYFYSTRVPQFMIFIDAVLEIMYGGIALSLDPNLKFVEQDSSMTYQLLSILFMIDLVSQDNLIATFVRGVGIEVFTCIMILRHFYKTQGLIYLKLSPVKFKDMVKVEHEEESEVCLCVVDLLLFNYHFFCNSFHFLKILKLKEL